MATELENLIDARKKIDARIKELQNADKYKYYDTVRLTKGEGGRNAYWRSIYRLKIIKYSSAIQSESGKYKTIIEDNDIEILYLHLKKIYSDINNCLKDIEIAREAKKNDQDNNTDTV